MAGANPPPPSNFMAVGTSKKKVPKKVIQAKASLSCNWCSIFKMLTLNNTNIENFVILYAYMSSSAPNN